MKNKNHNGHSNIGPTPLQQAEHFRDVVQKSIKKAFSDFKRIIKQIEYYIGQGFGKDFLELIDFYGRNWRKFLECHPLKANVKNNLMPYLVQLDRLVFNRLPNLSLDLVEALAWIEDETAKEARIKLLMQRYYGMTGVVLGVILKK